MATEAKVTHRHLVHAILRYVAGLPKASDTGFEIGAEEGESCEVACQCLEQATGVSLSQNYNTPIAGHDPSLMTIFKAGLAALRVATDSANTSPSTAVPTMTKIDDPRFQKILSNLTSKGYFKGTEPGSSDYIARYEKVASAFLDKLKKAGKSKAVLPEKSTDKKAPKPVTKENIAKAEAAKGEGNKLMAAGKHKEAIEKYTQATELDPRNAVYLVNRGVAQYKIHKFEDAERDCLRATELDPGYAKAWMRLGQVEMAMEKYKEAISHLVKAKDLAKAQGTAAACTKLLSRAEQALKEQKAAEESQSKNEETDQLASMLGALGGGGGDGAPDLSGLMNMLGGAGGLEGMLGNLANSMGTNGSDSRSEPDSKPSSSGNDAKGTSGLGGMINELANNPELAALKDDPDFKPIMEDIARDGIAGAMRHMNNPILMSKLPILMQQAGGLFGGMPGGGMPSGDPAASEPENLE